MKWLEIIEVRAVHIEHVTLQQKVVQLYHEMKIQDTIKVYVNVQIKTDLSIHIYHESKQLEAQGSDFGRRIKEMLKKQGLVNHTVWTGMNEFILQ